MAMSEELRADDPQAGQPARTEGRWEIIGPLECPLLYRRTLLASRWVKLLLHYFVPGASDHDPHDHPRSFLTIVFRGGYDDLTPCGCDQGRMFYLDAVLDCQNCDGSGYRVERLRAPALRFRRATHAHVTHVHVDGARTLVVMGPLQREWGFLRGGRWWPWVAYERRFGMRFRCER